MKKFFVTLALLLASFAISAESAKDIIKVFCDLDRVPDYNYSTLILENIDRNGKSETIELSQSMNEFSTSEDNKFAAEKRLEDAKSKLSDMNAEMEEWEKSAGDFNNSFNHDYDKIEYAIDLLQVALDVFGDRPDYTSFIVDEMKYLNDKRFVTLEKMKGEIYEKYVTLETKRLNVINDAIINVKNMDFVLSKFNVDNKGFKSFFKLFKKNKHESSEYLYSKCNIIQGSKRNKNRTYAANPVEITAMEEILKERFGCENHKFIMFIIEYLLFNLKGGLSTGFSTYYALTFRSIKDIYEGTYDIQEPEEFLKNFDKLFEVWNKALEAL